MDSTFLRYNTHNYEYFEDYTATQTLPLEMSRINITKVTLR